MQMAQSTRVDLTSRWKPRGLMRLPPGNIQKICARLLEEVNLQDGLFMTLACDWQQREDGVCGFIDVAFRPTLASASSEETQSLDQAFELYLSRQEKQHSMQSGTLINYARAVLDWSWSPLHQRHIRYEKVTLRYYCQQADDAEWCFDHLRHFLVSWYPAYRGKQ